MTILAREAGIPLELEDVPIMSLVPVELQQVSSIDEFMTRLPDFDADMAAQAAAAAEKV